VNWFMKLICITCVDTVQLNFIKVSWLLTVKFFNGYIYSHGRVKISNLLNRVSH
jgi:hypothetical protein